MWRLRSLLEQRERGATAVTVGLLMVALIGFTGLAVDGGASYAKNQELQNGADAAALAAAMECAENGCSTDSANLFSVAGPYGRDNVRNEQASVEVESFVVEGDEVTATVSGDQSHYFMPLFGFDKSTVSASATASFGHTNLPIAFAKCVLFDAIPSEWIKHGDDPYDISAEPPAGSDGRFEAFALQGGNGSGNGPPAPCTSSFFTPPGEPAPTLPPGGFGWLARHGCNVQVGIGPVNGQPGVAPPRDTDGSDCEWSSLLDHEYVLVPVFNHYSRQGNNAEYDIMAFVAVRVLGFRWKQGDGEYSHVGEECGPPPPHTNSNICVVAELVEYPAYTSSPNSVELVD